MNEDDSKDLKLEQAKNAFNNYVSTAINKFLTNNSISRKKISVELGVSTSFVNKTFSHPKDPNQKKHWNAFLIYRIVSISRIHRLRMNTKLNQNNLDTRNEDLAEKYNLTSKTLSNIHKSRDYKFNKSGLTLQDIFPPLDTSKNSFKLYQKVMGKCNFEHFHKFINELNYYI